MTLTPDASPLVLAERYRLDERIGAGSMGAVWRATDQLLGRTVAVKQLLLQPGAPGFDPRGYDEAKQRILREGRLAARLQHPHTISVFDVVLHDDAPWLVMEYLPSRTLNQLLLAEAPLDPRRVARIGWQIADGLTAAHAAGIVHRDIKPANVLISTENDSDAVVKITDFGVSRAADDVQLTRTGLIAGTPAYLAPEVARGQTPTPASDVFALGATLYTVLEGEPPFGLDDNAYALLFKVGEGNVRQPQRTGPLTDTLMRMLDKDPVRRPTAAEARDELARVAEGRTPAGVTTAPAIPLPTNWRDVGVTGGGDTKVDVAPLPVEPPPRRPPPPPAKAAPALPKRRRGWLVWGALALVVVAGAVAAALSMPWDTAAPGPSTVPPASGAARPSGTAAPSGTALPSGTASPSGTAPARLPATGQPPVAAAQPSPTDLENFVRDYYELLPGRPDAAWAMLGDSARAASGSLDSYRGFYGTIARITFVDGPTAVDARTVRATLRFEPRNGETSTENYEFTVVPGSDGRLEMRSFRRD